MEPRAALHGRRPGRQHVAHQGLLRHGAEGAGRVGQGRRRVAHHDVLPDHPAAGGADPRRRRAARVHRGDQRVPDGQRVPHAGREQDARGRPLRPDRRRTQRELRDVRRGHAAHGDPDGRAVLLRSSATSSAASPPVRSRVDGTPDGGHAEEPPRLGPPRRLDPLRAAGRRHRPRPAALRGRGPAARAGGPRRPGRPRVPSHRAGRRAGARRAGRGRAGAGLPLVRDRDPADDAGDRLPVPGRRGGGHLVADRARPPRRHGDRPGRLPAGRRVRPAVVARGPRVLPGVPGPVRERRRRQRRARPRLGLSRPAHPTARLGGPAVRRPGRLGRVLRRRPRRASRPGSTTSSTSGSTRSTSTPSSTRDRTTATTRSTTGTSPRTSGATRPSCPCAARRSRATSA